MAVYSLPRQINNQQQSKREAANNLIPCLHKRFDHCAQSSQAEMDRAYHLILYPHRFVFIA
jgi:hypothetical protein